MEKVTVYIDPKPTNITVLVNNLTGEKNVQSDWNESDNSKASYIQNKPFVAQKTSQLINDVPFATQAQLDIIINSLPKGVVFGGIVTWSGVGYTYNISLTVAMFETTYTIDAGSVTLDPADDTNNRLDTFYVTKTGFGFITGTPSADPLIPQLTDPDNQIYLTSVLVTANTTQPDPGDVSDEDIYQENIEWSGVKIGTGTADFADTNFPYSGLLAVQTTNLQNGFTLVFDKGEDFTISDYQTISFRIRLKAAMAAGYNLYLGF